MAKTTQNLVKRWYSLDTFSYPQLMLDAIDHKEHNFIIYTDQDSVLRVTAEVNLDDFNVVHIQIAGGDYSLYPRDMMNNADRLDRWHLVATDDSGVEHYDLDHPKLKPIYDVLERKEDYIGIIGVYGSCRETNVRTEASHIVYLKDDLYLAVSPHLTHILQGPHADRAVLSVKTANRIIP